MYITLTDLLTYYNEKYCTIVNGFNNLLVSIGPQLAHDISSDVNPLSYVNNVVNSIVVVIDLPLLRVAVEGSDNPVSLEKPCQASLPPDQQGRHSLGRHPEVQYVA